MRKRADWMTDKTDAILELLAETGAALSKRGIEINLKLRGYDVSYSTIKDHVRLAEATGLIEEVEETGAWYVISAEGKNYLNGTGKASEPDGDDIT